MNIKIVVATIAVVVVIGGISGCVEEPAPEVTPTPSPTPAPVETPVVPPTATPTVEMKITSCDMCHKTESTANLEAHVKGGLLVNGKPGCFNYAGVPSLASGCHGVGNATVHTVHPSEKAGCVACHGKEAPSIPATGPGGTTCELCHDKGNPLKPSQGRLVEIHLERGKDCTVCHIGEISQIHGLK